MAYSAGPAANPSGRTAEFSAGQTGTGMTASLLNKTNAMNQIPKTFDPASVLDAYQQPGFHPQNGNSPTDAARQLPSGAIPTTNGYSAGTYSMRFPSNLPTRLAIN